MQFRVREVLLVSSPYDAFTLEEDGNLADRLYAEYTGLNLPTAPRITHAPTGARAMELLHERRFDLVIAMMRIADVDVVDFAKRVKGLHGAPPVVLLALSEAELKASAGLPGAAPLARGPLDGVFVWTGDARILLAIIELIEDARNVAIDTRLADVRVILVVEDSVRRWSVFLTLLYAELMTQSSSLIAEGVNRAHKLVRMRARPKILLASTFEQAVSLWERYRDYVFGLMTDVRFPRGGAEDPEAGFALIDRIRLAEPELPVFVQSADSSSLGRAMREGLPHADKNSPRLSRQVHAFLQESLGFGEFVFRLPDRTEVGRARDVFEMERLLETVPTASVEYHASRNHFSLWLMARSMFHLAHRLRPRTIVELGGVEASREHILAVLREARMQEQDARITDFSEQRPGAQGPFVRIGKGSIGGKARGIAFVNSLLAREGLQRRFPGLEIRTPRTIAIGTDEFVRFIDDNGLADFVHRVDDGRAILRRFLDARLPDAHLSELEVAWQNMRGPIAVRSSSLLEDAQFQPFAGIYATYMLPNEHGNPHVRFDEVCRAIKAVYASTFSREARAYIAGTPYSIEDEKMGVIIQEMVGRRHGARFYPTISGVALSYNYYPASPLEPQDGVAFVALGLGHLVVQGGAALQFSPRSPAHHPQFPTPRDWLRYSQRQFWAVDLGRTTVDFFGGGEASLSLCSLADAEQDGTLHAVGSVYSAEDDILRAGLTGPGPRVVSFANVLEHHSLPLAEALDALLRAARRGMGCAVELELAVDVPRPGTGGEACLHVLQIRPQATHHVSGVVKVEELARDRIFCRTRRLLGHGVVGDVRDVIHVSRRVLESSATPAIAAAVGGIDAALRAERAPYLLVGPGRWGTSDPRLGVPVAWSQISGARIIVETSVAGGATEPSQGSHFFHNIASLGIGYLTVAPELDAEAFIDLDWLDAQPAARVVGEVRHVRFAQPLRAYLDATTSRATVVKPDE
jgi:CheY-like chemotaxis protein